MRNGDSDNIARVLSTRAYVCFAKGKYPLSLSLLPKTRSNAWAACLLLAYRQLALPPHLRRLQIPKDERCEARRQHWLHLAAPGHNRSIQRRVQLAIPPHKVQPFHLGCKGQV